MRKATLLTFIFYTLISPSYGQRISLADLKAFATKTTDEVAEKLITKNFELHSYPLGKEFRLEKGLESISVNFRDNDPYYTYKFVTLCFSSAYNKNYETLVSQIKSQGKKLSFFYSNDYKLYMTEYSIGNSCYVYICKGFCESLDHNTQFGAFFVSNESIQNKLK